MSVATKSAPRGQFVSVSGRKLAVSNLDKVLYPAVGFTKGEVIDYYLRIAPVLLPYLAARPLTLKRYPNGVDQPFFYEKRCPAHRPNWMSTTNPAPDSEGHDAIEFCQVNSAAGLVWLANLASLELHPLLCKSRSRNRPTWMVFDLDPGAPAGLLECCRIGLLFHDLLERLGLKSFAKTSGGKGLHVYVPLNTAVTFEQTKTFSKAVATLLERRHPQAVTARMSQALRPGKVFIDWSQNDARKTTACVYSLRARELPTVSTPVTWTELNAVVTRGSSEGLVFTTDDVLKRVAKSGDLFASIRELKQRLPS